MPFLAQGVLLGLALSVALPALGALLWWGTWGRAPRWEEVRRHGWRPWVLVERWIRCRWVHRDATYWLLRIRLDRGPVVLQGRPPPGVYWSITCYRWTDAHHSVHCDDVQLDDDGRYRIVLSPERAGPNWIEVEPGTRRAMIYLRVYLPEEPTPLPRVVQGDRVLVPSTSVAG